MKMNRKFTKKGILMIVCLMLFSILFSTGLFLVIEFNMRNNSDTFLIVSLGFLIFFMLTPLVFCCLLLLCFNFDKMIYHVSDKGEIYKTQDMNLLFHKMSLDLTNQLGPTIHIQKIDNVDKYQSYFTKEGINLKIRIDFSKNKIIDLISVEKEVSSYINSKTNIKMNYDFVGHYKGGIL